LPDSNQPGKTHSKNFSIFISKSSINCDNKYHGAVPSDLCGCLAVAAGM
ncbi:5126_t:CDS:1, partial [Racocetra persica]